MESVNPTKWVSRGIRVETHGDAWCVMFSGPRRWWCADRAVLTVYRTDSATGRRLAPSLTSEFFVLFDTELADDVVEPVESIEQLAQIAVSWAPISSPENRAARRLARAA